MTTRATFASTTDAMGNVTTYTYDDRHRQIAVTLPDPDGDGPLTGSVTQYVYNAVGQLQSVIGSLDQATTYEYDDLGRQVAQTTYSADDLVNNWIFATSSGSGTAPPRPISPTAAPTANYSATLKKYSNGAVIVNNVLLLDGDGDAVQIGDADKSEITGPLAVSARVYAEDLTSLQCLISNAIRQASNGASTWPPTARSSSPPATARRPPA